MKRIGLALGGGGIRGIAHILYLKAMEEAGVRPAVISGTSSGAIAGAMYAGGMKPDEMLETLQGLLNAGRVLSAAFHRKDKRVGGSLTALAKRTLEGILPVKTFEELEIPLRIVATNMHTLGERVFSEGPIIGPLMASVSYPSVFFPQLVDGEYYVDGGATNIVPFDILRRECDVLIAIDVSAVRANRDAMPCIRSAVHATWAATQETLISQKLQQCPVDIFERPVFGDVGTFEFGLARQIISRTEDGMSGFKQKLTRLLEGEKT